ncbi:MAG: hypothetical protein M1608_02380 [Candidatus Omnitrophica bacterium]|nr:hypothetical protein [Candidatus Omnitrophota bacterium]
MAIAAGYNNNLALKADGQVVAWNIASPTLTPDEVPPNATNVVAVAAGLYHYLALKANGEVVAWGNNNYGQTNVPAGLSNVIAVAGGAGHSLALKTDQTVVAWGGNASGQIDVPSGLTNVVAIAAGARHSLALKSDGTVIGWGDNTYGQATVPYGLSNVVAIASKNLANVVLKADESAVAWGYGGYQFPSWLTTNIVRIAACYNTTFAVINAPIPPGRPSVQTMRSSYGVGMKIESVPGWWLYIDYTPDLREPVTWTNLRYFNLTNSPILFVDPNQTNATAGFYRVGFPTIGP